MVRLYAALISLFLLCGCGYRPVSSSESLLSGPGVNVIVFGNKTYRAGIEGTLARDLVDTFARRTGGKVVSAHEAEQELTGNVLSYEAGAVSYTAQDVIREYRAVIKVEAILRERRTQKVLWKGILSDSQVYPVNQNIALQQNAEDAAIARMCERLSEGIWEKIASRF